MNTECIYSTSYNTEDEAQMKEHLKNVAKDIEAIQGEIYPISIARLTRDIKATRDVDNYGRNKILKNGTMVLFVGGKLHHMNIIHHKCPNPEYYHKLTPYFPNVCADYELMKGDWFEDIETL